MYFTEEHNLFRKSLQDFLQKEVVPHIEKWEKTGNIDRFIWKKFGDMGFFGINYPEAYGGMDLDLFYTVILLEELQKINSGGFAAAIWAHVYLAMTHLQAEGDEAIKQKYLIPSISGDKIGCLCISEPFGGSDVAGMRTTAIKNGDHYLINGSKTFITNGVLSDYLIVTAKTTPELGNKGISIFVLDRDMAGVSATKLNKLGWNASDTGEIAFANVKVPVENLLGEENKGWTYAKYLLQKERSFVARVAQSRHLVQRLKSSVSEQKVGAVPLLGSAEFRRRMARLEIDLQALEYTELRYLSKELQGEPVGPEPSILKIRGSEIQQGLKQLLVESLGMYGVPYENDSMKLSDSYMEVGPEHRHGILAEHLYGRGATIFGGSNEIQRNIISRMLLGT